MSCGDQVERVSSAGGEVLVGAGGIVTAAAAGVVARAVMQSYAKRQIDKRDTASLREFFFDTERNESTGVPAKKGWTTKVDERLTSQDTMLREIQSDVKRLANK